MYGLIHQGIKGLMLEKLGYEKTDHFFKKAEIAEADFVATLSYPDSKTTALITVAAQALSVEADELLHIFGRFWVKNAFSGPYAEIMKFTGNNLPDFVQNLDRMHNSVCAAIPGASVPSFSVVEQSSTGMIVKYQSSRMGLDKFVIGLLEGLLSHFHLSGIVEQMPSETEHIFAVQWHGK